jgi:hypothetical protein
MNDPLGTRYGDEGRNDGPIVASIRQSNPDANCLLGVEIDPAFPKPVAT